MCQDGEPSGGREAATALRRMPGALLAFAWARSRRKVVVSCFDGEDHESADHESPPSGTEKSGIGSFLGPAGVLERDVKSYALGPAHLVVSVCFYVLFFSGFLFFRRVAGLNGSRLTTYHF